MQNRAVRIINDLDAMARLVTGRNLSQLGLRALWLLGPTGKEEQQEAVSLAPTPYDVLGIRCDASDTVVRAAFRALSQECHPDHLRGDADKFNRIKEAYDEIRKARGI